MARLSNKIWLYTAVLTIVLACIVQAATPPIVPHIIYWNGAISTWAQGTPWVKVMMREDITTARAAGAVRIFYRPYEVNGRDDGQCNDGAAMANQVLALLSTVPTNQWPEAIGYRNEFTDTSPTPQQFIPYYDTLRAGGYNGMIIYGSYSVGWPGETDWGLPQVMAAANKADGIETHEYFDLTVGFQDTWLCRRHVRDISNYPYLLGKPWFIGEFGSGPAWCPMEDPQCRQGWSDRGKMTAQQYIDQISIYRNTVADQIKAVFLFTDGDNGGWPGYPVCGTAVGDWMKNNTWAAKATISGTVKTSGGVGILGATVSTNTGGYTCTTNSAGRYTLLGVAAGTYNVTASKSGYNPSSSNVTATVNTTTTANFILGGGGGGSGSITGYVKDLTNNAISGATVSTNTGGYTTTTAADGTYTLANVTAGTYNVTAAKTGYNSKTNNGVVVTSGNATTSNFNVQNTTNSNTPTGSNNAPQSTTVNADTYYGAGFEGSKAVDASTSTKWCTTGAAPPHWLALDLGQNRTVNGFVVKFPGGCGEQSYYNAKNFSIQSATSMSGPWSDEVVVDNTAQANTVSRSYVLPRTLRYVRLYITNAGIDNYSRIYEFEVWCGSCSVPTITTQPASQTRNVGESATFSLSATGATGYQWKKGGTNISGATNASYTIASVVTGDAGNYTCAVSNSCGSVTSNTATLTVNAGGPIASEAFTTLPTWSSTFDASWGSAATFSSVTGGQSGNQMQAARSSNGSSVKAKVYTVPSSTNITISAYIKCPSYSGGAYWVETGYKMGSNTAQDFDANPATWTQIKTFSDSGANGNGNVWTQYTATVNTGSNTQITIGYKHGAYLCVGPTMGWDTFAIN